MGWTAWAFWSSASASILMGAPSASASVVDTIVKHRDPNDDLSGNYDASRWWPEPPDDGRGAQLLGGNMTRFAESGGG